MITLSNIINFYKTLGSNTRLVIKTTLILFTTFFFLGSFANYADFIPFHYELLLISDELLATARAFLSIGLIGAFIFNHLEKKE